MLTRPEDKPRCCSNDASVSVPVEKFGRYVIDMPYKSPEWEAYYASARNQMEGKNGFVKNPLGANIAQAGQRRMRGIGRPSHCDPAPHHFRQLPGHRDLDRRRRGRQAHLRRSPEKEPRTTAQPGPGGVPPGPERAAAEDRRTGDPRPITRRMTTSTT